MIKASLWGYPMIVRADHRLPGIVARQPLWSLPLLHAVNALEKERVVVIDVGANTGDTAVLLEAHLPGVCDILCIEPDDDFFTLCQLNTTAIPRVKVLKAFVGDSTDSVSIVPGDPGTAGTQLAAGGNANCVPLDCLAKDFAADRGGIDVIKIDTDGFDFKVIRSSAGLLRQFFPVLFFEFHPLAWEMAGDRPEDVFAYVGEFGYRHFVFFHNDGTLYAQVSDPSELFVKTLIELHRAQDGGTHIYFDVLTGPADACMRAASLNLSAIRRANG